MSDEGVGGFVVERFIKQAGNYPDVEFVDAGTGGMSILHLIADRRKAILVDCAMMGTSPGTIKKFSPDDVISIKGLRHYSLHEADILRIIELSRQLGEQPKKIVIFGIEPVTVALGQKLSATVAEKISDYIDAIAEELTA